MDDSAGHRRMRQTAHGRCATRAPVAGDAATARQWRIHLESPGGLTGIETPGREECRGRVGSTTRESHPAPPRVAYGFASKIPTIVAAPAGGNAQAGIAARSLAGRSLRSAHGWRIA